MSNRPLVSVITVCYQAEKEIATTIQSVKNQTYKNFEYIIVDGASEDYTLETAKVILQQFDIGIDTKILSEPDRGIYDAMNKGIQRAKGEWIIFMNAGDEFYNEGILEQIYPYLQNADIDVLYGNQFWNEKDNTGVRIPGGAEKLPNGASIFHQSSFVRTKILKENLFDLDYRIAGDYELFLRLYMKKYNFYYISEIIAKFAYGGESSIHPLVCLKENTLIREKYGCIDSKTLSFKIWYIREYCYQFVKGIIPRKLDLIFIKWKKSISKNEDT